MYLEENGLSAVLNGREGSDGTVLHIGRWWTRKPFQLKHGSIDNGQFTDGDYSDALFCSFSNLFEAAGLLLKLAHHFTLLGKTFKVKDSPLLFSHQKQPETLELQIQKF